jgi:hypothetical protein
VLVEWLKVKALNLHPSTEKKKRKRMRIVIIRLSEGAWHLPSLSFHTSSPSIGAHFPFLLLHHNIQNMALTRC